MYGEQARFFDDEIYPTIKHTKKGLAAMAGMDQLVYSCERTEEMRRRASRSAPLRQRRETCSPLGTEYGMRGTCIT